MDYDIAIGLDAGRAMHHACALGPDGKRLLTGRAAIWGRRRAARRA